MHSVPEAAKILGLAPATLRQQIRNGKLKARKISRDWYLTPEEVARYAAENRRATFHKLTWAKVHDIRARVAAGESQHSLARKHGVSQPAVHFIVTGKTWPEPDITHAVGKSS